VHSFRLLAFALAVALVTAHAQDFRGSIAGRVIDPSGANVPSAKISAVNQKSGVASETVSNESGNYQILFLIPGQYTLTVDVTGFKRLERRGIDVNADSRTNLDLTLAVGSNTESVTVTAEAPMLDTSSPDLGRTITTEFVEHTDFAMNRNVMTLVHLAPSVTGTAGGTYTGQGAPPVAINGGGGKRGANEYMVDGIPDMTPDGGLNYTPSMDGVNEFKVHNTMFDASLGHSNGGAISLSTKPGTNDWHGTAYGYRRVTWMNAAGWTNNRLGNPRPQNDYYQYGYLLSGPVRIPKIYDGRNRTFFTHSLEKDNDNRPLTVQGRVPTDLERSGDFSQTKNKQAGALSIYDPLTTVVNGSNATRQAFPGAKVPSSRLDPTGVAVLSKFPMPNQPVAPQIGSNNWGMTGYYTVKQGNYMGRLDHYLTAKQRLFFRYGQVNRDQDIAKEFFPGSNCGNCNHQRYQGTNVGLDDTYVFSPHTVGDFRVGVARNSLQSKRGGFGRDPGELSLASSLIANQFAAAYPTFALGEGFSPFGSLHPYTGNNLISGLGTVTHLWGNHSTKIGIDYRLGRSNLEDPGASAFGNFTFNNTFTRSNPFTTSTGNTSGTSMASLLLGYPASGQLGYTSPVALQNNYWAAFIQDDWKVSRRLTLNAGMRWEMETPYTERYNRMTYGYNWNASWPSQVPGVPLRGGVLFAGVNGNPRMGGNLDKNNFGPRFGFAYLLNSRTTVRGGYGIFFASTSENGNFHGQIGSFDLNTPLVGTIDNGATPYVTMRNPFPGGMQSILGSSPGLAAQAGGSLSVHDLGRVSPYSQQWQISVQRELPSRVLLEAAYLGMLTLKSPESFNMNELPDMYRSAAQNVSVPNPFLGIFPSTSTLGQGATTTQGNLWGRFPQYDTFSLEGAPTGRSIYHAMQLKVDKRVTRGLSVIGAYTFSRLMTANTTSLINVRHYRSVAQYDQKNFLRAALVYQMPFRWTGSWQKRAADLLFGGWELSSHFVWDTGLPLTVTDSNGRPYRIAPVALSGSVAGRLGDRKDASGNVLNPYFNINAFASLQSQYVVTPEPPYMDELRAPSEKSLNLQLLKGFAVTERFKLMFNIEADDALNSPLFDSPGTDLSNKATFGVITSDHGGRTVMMSLRMRF
jgi:hypothetical protein